MIESRIACSVCLRRCRLKQGGVGFCGIWRREGEAVVAAKSLSVTECTVETIEKKGVFHYRPGSIVYALGGWGCNLHCSHCRNQRVACVRSAPEGAPIAPADRLVAVAQAAGCAGLAWGFTEPTLWYEVVCEISAWAQASGLFTLVCTNGIASPQVYERLCGCGVEAWKIDLKGFSTDAYREATGFTAWRGILDNLVALRSAGGHLELSWCPIPGADADLGQVRAMGRWIVDHLGAETPMHLNAFFPAHRKLHLPFGDSAFLRPMRDAFLETGMQHVYLPQSLSPGERATRCGHCRALLVERPAFGKPRFHTNGSNRCTVCGHSAPIVLQ